jgi:allophanate hydrolase subunit 2
MSIHLTVSGLATLQDQGRHHAHLGVPVAGPLNRDAYTQAAALINEENPAVIEMLHGQVTVRAVDDTVLVAVIGDADVTSGTVGMSFALYPGDTMTVHHNHRGPVYIAAAGLTAPQVLGSASYDTLSRLGGAPLTSGTSFETAPWSRNLEDLIGRFVVNTPTTGIYNIRYIPGPHAPTPEFLNQEWTVTSAARSGVRLAPVEPTGARGRADLASLPVTPGTIQLPPDGNPIILGPDSGVTGGYPVVGHIITADLHRLSYLAPGTTIRLTAVTSSLAADVLAKHTTRARSAVITSLYGV